MEIILDDWQKEVLSTKGHLCLCSGRQVGKSTVIAIKAGEFAVKNPKKSVMIIAAVERQALLLFEKVLAHIFNNYRKFIKKGRDRPTKHELKLTNGSIIRCLPTGDSGYGIRGYTIDELYADEAHFIPEDVWAAVTPMLATTGGRINLLSTPFGTTGYFHRAFYDKRFHSIHVNTEEVAEKRLEPQRTRMLEHLREEKKRMTKLQYQQEYLGLFVGGIQRFIEDELIEKVCILEKHSVSKGQRDNFLGVDIARMGGDETVLASVRRHGPGVRREITQYDLQIPEGQTLTDTARLIKHADASNNYKKIYLDDGGLGVGVFDILHEDKQTKRKVVGLNNARRSIDKEQGKDNPRGKKLLGEDMAVNLKILMETDCIKLIDDPRIRQSLRSMQFENEDGVLKIYGSYSHIFEALKRAAWCAKDKTLNIYIY
jgi:hypothetical protein